MRLFDDYDDDYLDPHPKRLIDEAHERLSCCDDLLDELQQLLHRLLADVAIPALYRIELQELLRRAEGHR